MNNLNLYKETLNTMTPLEITLKCHSRSVEFIELSIDALVCGNKISFIENVNNALKIIETFMYSLELYDNNGSLNDAAVQSFRLYEFITSTLRDGMLNYNTINFKECCVFLTDLYKAYSLMSV